MKVSWEVIAGIALLYIYWVGTITLYPFIKHIMSKRYDSTNEPSDNSSPVVREHTDLDNK